MSHPNQHGGWASAAKRRGESYVFCNECGKTEVRPRFQATPEISAPRRESVKDFVLALAVWGLVLAALGGMWWTAWTLVVPS